MFAPLKPVGSSKKGKGATSKGKGKRPQTAHVPNQAEEDATRNQGSPTDSASAANPASDRSNNTEEENKSVSGYKYMMQDWYGELQRIRALAAKNPRKEKGNLQKKYEKKEAEEKIKEDKDKAKDKANSFLYQATRGNKK